MNATNAHTPGPWRYNPDRICIESETAWSIEPDPSGDEEGSRVSVVHTQGAMGGNVEADLRLIAAAPAMLAALEDALETCEQAAQRFVTIVASRGGIMGDENRVMVNLANSIDTISAALRLARGS